MIIQSQAPWRLLKHLAATRKTTTDNNDKIFFCEVILLIFRLTVTHRKWGFCSRHQSVSYSSILATLAMGYNLIQNVLRSGMVYRYLGFDLYIKSNRNLNVISRFKMKPQQQGTNAWGNFSDRFKKPKAKGAGTHMSKMNWEREREREGNSC